MYRGAGGVVGAVALLRQHRWPQLLRPRRRRCAQGGVRGHERARLRHRVRHHRQGHPLPSKQGG